MTDQRRSEGAPEASDQPKRAWSEPWIDVIPISDSEGAVSGAPITDGLSGHS